MIIFAHRGLSGEYPENSLKAFKKAVEAKVDGIEFDVHITKDKVPVVIHDFKIDRVSNGKGYVANFTFSELRKFVLRENQFIPRLEEVLEIIPPDMPINVELKGNNSAFYTYEVLERFIKNKKLSYKLIIVSSFSHREIKAFAELSNNKFKLGVVLSAIPISYIKFAKKLSAYCINPSIAYITKRMVKKAHSNGFKVFLWTVNNEKQLKKAVKLNVDGVFSNYADKLKNL